MSTPSTKASVHSTPMSSKLAEMLLTLKSTESITFLTPNDGKQANDKRNKEVDEDKESEGGEEMREICNCRKSRCLKLYCQCFAAKAVCTSGCHCVSCANTDSPDNADVRAEAIKSIIQRNPHAFDSKFKAEATGDAILAHKTGCRCRKSMCLKKYCECFQASIHCSSTCTCQNCFNTNSSSSRQNSGNESISMAMLREKMLENASKFQPDGGNEDTLFKAAQDLALLRSKNKIQQQVSMTMGMLDDFSDKASPSSESAQLSIIADVSQSASKPPLPPNKRARLSSGSNSTVSSPESDDSSGSCSSSSSHHSRPRSVSPSSPFSGMAVTSPLTKPGILGRRDKRATSPISQLPDPVTNTEENVNTEGFSPISIQKSFLAHKRKSPPTTVPASSSSGSGIGLTNGNAGNGVVSEKKSLGQIRLASASPNSMSIASALSLLASGVASNNGNNNAHNQSSGSSSSIASIASTPASMKSIPATPVHSHHSSSHSDGLLLLSEHGMTTPIHQLHHNQLTTSTSDNNHNSSSVDSDISIESSETPSDSMSTDNSSSPSMTFSETAHAHAHTHAHISQWARDSASIVREQLGTPSMSAVESC